MGLGWKCLRTGEATLYPVCVSVGPSSRGGPILRFRGGPARSLCRDTTQYRIP
ncbi:hypothetical protein T484DRAFT_1947461 [Baffinella frigidus]|nr:hypothetical protein T484DRAFT_1947461 [Cryptophyta sp. CCMP2293]